MRLYKYILPLLATVMVACSENDNKGSEPEPPAPPVPEVPTPDNPDTPDTPEAETFAIALVNQSASVEAKKVYAMLLDRSGKEIISGAMANVNNNNDFAGWIDKITGKYPALTGYDFIHLPESPANWIDYSDITPALGQWTNGGLVSYMWHWRAPDSEEAYNSRDINKYGFYISGSDGTSFDIREALKDGTWQNRFILEDIDKVASYLKLLADAGIPVIWRPLHEAAGSYQYGAWFWWGRYGDTYTAELWRLMYDRLVRHHGLDNLIWVWTAQYQEGYADRMKGSYPGDDYVDIIGVDLYEKNTGSQAKAYKAALDMTGGKKLVALSECGLIPDPQKCISESAPWAWFMMWYTYDIHKNGATTDGFGNTSTWLREVMDSPFVLTRGSLGQYLK